MYFSRFFSVYNPTDFSASDQQKLKLENFNFKKCVGILKVYLFLYVVFRPLLHFNSNTNVKLTVALCPSVERGNYLLKNHKTNYFCFRTSCTLAEVKEIKILIQACMYFWKIIKFKLSLPDSLQLKSISTSAPAD